MVVLIILNIILVISLVAVNKQALEVLKKIDELGRWIGSIETRLEQEGISLRDKK